METVLWFNWSSCSQQDSNITSKEMTVKKVSSLKTRKGAETQLLNSSEDCELLSARVAAAFCHPAGEGKGTAQCSK